MYGNKPNRWSPELAGMERLRFIINCFTRLRYCSSDGVLGLSEKGPPGSQAEHLLPWFEVPARASATERIICGHWSTLGFVNRHNVWSLDTGCLWGGSLTAVRIRKRRPLVATHRPCPGAAAPATPA
jgi:bis(5'-nucleosyl)-tetraphosphatase (symmetrical)